MGIAGNMIEGTAVANAVPSYLYIPDNTVDGRSPARARHPLVIAQLHVPAGLAIREFSLGLRCVGLNLRDEKNGSRSSRFSKAGERGRDEESSVVRVYRADAARGASANGVTANGSSPSIG